MADNNLPEHDHSGTGNGGEHISPESVNADKVNATYTLSNGDSLNQIVNNTDLPAKFVLPSGKINYDGMIDNVNDTVIIEGQGSNSTTVQASNSNTRLFNIFNDNSGSSHVLRGLTLDLDFIPSNGRYLSYDFGAVLDRLVLDDVTIKNMDLTDHTTSDGLIRFDEATINEVIVKNGCQFLLDTAQNIQPNQLAVVRTTPETDMDRIYSDPSTYVHGGYFRQTDPNAFSRGFDVRVQKTAVIDGTFEGVTTYCAIIYLQQPESVGVCAGRAINVGEGDQWEIRGTGGTAVFECEVNGIGDPVPNGDRGIITKGSPDRVVLRNPSVNDVLVGAEFRGFGTLQGSLTLTDVGSKSTTRPGLLILDADSTVGKINVDVNIKNTTTERDMDPAIDFGNNSGDYEPGTAIVNGLVDGHEGTLIDESVPADVTVNDDRLFDDT